jgi:hypothetical protein
MLRRPAMMEACYEVIVERDVHCVELWTQLRIPLCLGLQAL